MNTNQINREIISPTSDKINNLIFASKYEKQKQDHTSISRETNDAINSYEEGTERGGCDLSLDL